MSAALKTADLSNEALAFVKRGTPQPAFVAPTPQEPSPVVAIPSAAAQPSPASESQPAAEVTTTKPRPAAKKSPLVTNSSVVGVSTRLPEDIQRALMRASFERKMDREEPWTQQDIAAEAFSDWLKKRGYL
jgi:hypothetical protein